ncbi:MAG: fructose-1,6-bisphosphatase [Clostridiales bacterium]|nr:fructose-1,6-bisphosphatase [Clostridiales bacterium]
MTENAYSPERVKYLSLLAEQFSTFHELCMEIINLSGVLSLPKGTEHFMSDIHGEYEAFYHILNNCSGVVREKVQLWLGDHLTQQGISELCTLIYYPSEKLRLLREAGVTTDEWYRKTLTDLVYLARKLSSKYTRSKVRKAMPSDFAYILDELLHAQTDEDDNQNQYHETILDTLLDIKNGNAFIIALSALIKRLAVDRLHVVGDIFDRGPRADSILDMLMEHHSVDIEWGNHDILWMGAASGSLCCIAAVVRNCLAYNNMQILENGYGIPLRPLTLFAEKLYPDLTPEKAALQAVSIMMFKLEGQLIKRNPSFQMEDRLLLERISPAQKTVEMDNYVWPIRDIALPTIDWADPYALTEEEQEVMNGLQDAFLHSLRLRTHVEFLYTRGRLYRRYNGNLLFHGCIPLDENGEFLEKQLGNQTLSGKALMDYADSMARKAYFTGRQDALDFMWYLWCGDDSPVCGRKIKTFARFFIPDEESWHEPRNPYYDYYNDEKVCEKMLAAFGLDSPQSRIVNGHTPIRVTHGESPIKAGGRLIVIDGGFCKAYQKATGIAGYTLIANSHGMRIMSHHPFTTLEDALEANRDIRSQSFDFAVYPRRMLVKDTDNGHRLQERIDDLKDLLAACRAGIINLVK